MRNAANLGLTVQYVDLGGADIKNRLIAERANPVADIVYGLNEAFYHQLVDEGVLEPCTPAWSHNVRKSYEVLRT